MKMNNVTLSLDKEIILSYPFKNGKIASEEFFLLKMEFDKLTKLMAFVWLGKYMI